MHFYIYDHLSIPAWKSYAFANASEVLSDIH